MEKQREMRNRERENGGREIGRKMIKERERVEERFNQLKERIGERQLFKDIESRSKKVKRQRERIKPRDRESFRVIKNRN